MKPKQRELFKPSQAKSFRPEKREPVLRDGVLTLHVQSLGVIPNFKNHKRWVTQLPNGKPLKRPFLMTVPRIQELMQNMTASFESQLLSVIQTTGVVTLTEPMKRLLIASLLPGDDCWTKIPEATIKAELCEPGDEGATIIIERIR